MEEKTHYGQVTIRSFLNDLARDTPTLPAGGCAEALVGATAAALFRFVAQVALRGNKNPERKENLTTMISRLKSLQEACVKTMDRDKEAYHRIIKASRLVNTTQSEQFKREAALQKAKTGALIPPTELIRCGLEMLRCGFELIQEGLPGAVADAGAAAEMAHACVWGGIWMVRSNLMEISDTDLVTQHRKILDMYRKEEEGLYGEITKELKNRLHVHSSVD